MNPPSADAYRAMATSAWHPFPSLEINTTSSNKKKRRPAGTPDPDAEVVSLSPRTLLQSDRYVCEICNQGFQRDQNLQMHRRRHKVPWKLVKREGQGEVRKRVFVCPEPSCLHHDPCHALGDLSGIKKHFRRKHSGQRQLVCTRCAKGYAVQTDYKTHPKTCGTRGHSCDCGRVFSRVESFIEHQDTCNAGRSRASAATSTSSSSDIIPSPTAWPLRMPTTNMNIPLQPSDHQTPPTSQNLELQLLPPSDVDHLNQTATAYNELNQDTCLRLSIGLDSKPNASETKHERLKEDSREQLRVESFIEHQDTCNAGRSRASAATSTSPSSDIIPSPTAWPLRMPTTNMNIPLQPSDHQTPPTSQNLELQLLPPSDVDRLNQTATAYNELNQDTCLRLSIGLDSKPNASETKHERLKEDSREQLRLAMVDKARANEARHQAKRQVDVAEQELANAKRIRLQAQMEISKAHAIRDHAMRQINATLLQITCFSCKRKSRVKPTAGINSDMASYVSSIVTREENDEKETKGRP